MKSKTSILFFLGAFMFLISTDISGQMVGLPFAQAHVKKIKIEGFFVKIGTAIPINNFHIVPILNPSPPNNWEQMPISNGNMGAKIGMYFETGLTLSITSQKDKLVGFYFYPIVVSYWQTGLDWSSLGGFFTDQSIYTNPFNVIDVGQRYGIAFQPINKLKISLYYRPGLILPLPFEILHLNASEGELFQVAGTMSSSDYAPVLQMSHTLGLEIKYSLISLSAELCTARPSYDVSYLDSQPEISINSHYRGKIPIELFNLSLAVSF